MGKDLSYLEAFSSKSLREARRILDRGFTAENIDRFLENRDGCIKNIMDKAKPSRRLPRGVRKQIIANTKFGKKKP